MNQHCPFSRYIWSSKSIRLPAAVMRTWSNLIHASTRRELWWSNCLTTCWDATFPGAAAGSWSALIAE